MTKPKAKPEQLQELRAPIYIVSKGRWQRPLTARALERMNVSYKMIVEASQYEEYAKVIEPKPRRT